VLIIQNCAKPDFRDELNGYLEMVEGGHTPQTLTAAFRMHEQYLRTGDMRGWIGASLWDSAADVSRALGCAVSKLPMISLNIAQGLPSGGGKFPASAFPERAGVYLCDHCARDITKHLKPRRAHVLQVIGPPDIHAVAVNGGAQAPLNGTTWTIARGAITCLVRSSAALCVAASSVLAALVYVALRGWTGAAMSALLTVAIPSVLPMAVLSIEIAASMWRLG
jgi:hypothetical protein